MDPSSVGRLQSLVQKCGFKIPVYKILFLGHDPIENTTQHRASVYVPELSFEFTGPVESSKAKAKEQTAKLTLDELGPNLEKLINSRESQKKKKKDYGCSGTKRKNQTKNSSKCPKDTTEKKEYSLEPDGKRNCGDIVSTTTPYIFRGVIVTHLIFFDLDTTPELISHTWADTSYKIGFCSQKKKSLIERKKFMSECILYVLDSNTTTEMLWYIAETASSYSKYDEIHKSYMGVNKSTKPHMVIVSKNKFVTASTEILQRKGFECTVVRNMNDIKESF